MNEKKYEQTLIQLVIEQIKFDFNQNEDENLKKLLQSILKENDKNLIAYVSSEYPEEFKRDMKSRKDWFIKGVLRA